MGQIDQYPIASRNYLSFASATSAKTGWGQFEQDRVIGGGLRIVGETFTKGLGVHATSELIYDLAGKGYSRFFAKVGQNDQGFDTNLASAPGGKAVLASASSLAIRQTGLPV